MRRFEVERRINKIIAEQFGVDEDEVTGDALLVRDLGAERDDCGAKIERWDDN